MHTVKTLFFLSILFAASLTAGFTEIEDRSSLKVLTPSMKEQVTAKGKLSNGIEVLLISDPSAEKSGAALSVMSGSWKEPSTFPGLAHYLEHMLFLGTEKFPEEAAFEKYIKEHGGLFNAYTAPDRTSYFFSINHTAYTDAIEQFSWFFRSPLLDDSGAAREMKAIDQEWAKNLNSDHYREIHVFKELANPNHPYHRFSSGSSATLKNATPDDLRSFFESYYSANQMHLVLYSPQPLDELKNVAESFFSQIKDSALPNWETNENLFPEELLGKMIYIEPRRDIRTLNLSWELPKQFASKTETRPENLLGFVLGHEGEFSLLDRLKAEGLADSLRAGGGRIGPSNFIFSIDITLTTKGLEHREQVIQRCFQAINRLKERELPRSLFDEITTMQKLEHQYKGRQDAYRTVQEHIGQLPYEPLETYPDRTALIHQFNPSDVAEMLSLMSAERCIYSISAPASELEIEFDKTEKWNGTNYTVRPVDEDLLMAWQRVALHPKIRLPEKNPFIPQSLQLVTKSGPGQETIPSPAILDNSDRGKMYFYNDDFYRVPEVAFAVELKTPKVSPRSPEHQVLIDLYLRALQDELDTFTYTANMGGLNLSLSNAHQGISINVSGFSEHAGLFLERIMKQIPRLEAKQMRFDIYKEMLTKSYQNFSKEGPLSQGLEVLESILHKDYVTSSEKAKALEGITYSDFSEFANGLFSKTYVNALLYGNLTESTAVSIWNKIHSELGGEPFPVSQHDKPEVIVLPPKRGPYFVETQTKSAGNAVVLAIQNGPYSFKNRALQQILSQSLNEPFYTALRTKQQTAYIVHNFSQEIERQLFTLFAAQSNSHDGRDLLARFELLLEDYVQELGQESQEAQDHFANVREALLVRLKHMPDNLQEMGALLKTLSFDYDGDFEWMTKRIQGFEEITFNDYTAFAKDMIGRVNRQRVGILVKGKIPKENSLRYRQLRKAAILKKIGAYRSKDEAFQTPQ